MMDCNDSILFLFFIFLRLLLFTGFNIFSFYLVLFHEMKVVSVNFVVLKLLNSLNLIKASKRTPSVMN